MMDDWLELDGGPYGLMYQLQRAGASVPANTVEGCGDSTPAGPVRAVRMARIAQAEMRLLIELSKQEFAPERVAAEEKSETPVVQ